MGLSLRPSTFSAGGSLIDDVDATIVRARFEMFDYGGKSDSGPAPTLLLVLKDKEDVEHAQYYSAGQADRYAPSVNEEDADLNGITLEALGESQAMNGGCNAAILLNSLVQAGFPEDLLDKGDTRVLEGLKGHWNRIPQPKRSNLPKKEGAREAMILICSSIISLPGDPKKSSGPADQTKSSAGSSKTTGAATPSSTSAGGELQEALQFEVMNLFNEKQVTSLKKVEISQGLFKSIGKDSPNFPLKSKLMSASAKDDNLKALEGFSYSGSVLTQE